ncbi:[LSU ribosomal protein L11P]-lysine N-methyltransferase [Geoalkalibacter ferrihydriticus]|uniref:Ribosomal protein L11 methyltransferase n=3 Tax=Geoalkalibacter ferrihydriticus TaxID=392333 RepID=A0A0C2HLB6_9BACT|nr:50S ribosomal protein L11 methyltransferase [Geoalkalibacter ferrihydriticus]KIH75785.1 ribosomal protein L11 methyltransferase [Geoalkalibacter ferrihydriticus DSM 17813]SDM64910.1 [LSU ribosomal protein L11P]-lysine N-methyltransferase [Geoalkalibacter ferrihydriticus]
MTKDTYPAFTIGKRFRIIPPDCAAPRDDRINLIIAKGAFGSGEHETSASCIEILEELQEVKKARILDLGSGTGILALAALKLGAEDAVCVDINPDAVRTCEKNCRLNALDQRVRNLAGSLDSIEEKDFDLALANIYGDLLLDFAPELVARVRTGGFLLLSGILWEFNFDVRACYEKLGCRVVQNRMLQEFSTILLQKS